MKILLATYSLAFQNPGGGERVLLSLEKELQSFGHQVTFFDPWLHDVRDFDVIHYFSTLENSFWLHAKNRAPNTPLLITPTVYLPNTLSSRIQGRLSALRRHAQAYMEGESDPFQLPDYWLPTTQAEARGLQLNYRISCQKISCLPNGVEPFFAQGNAKEFRQRAGIEGPFALHVGRFHPVKNHLTLIEALGRAGIQGVFIGDPDMDQGPYFEACTQAIQKYGSKMAVFQGISHQDPFLAGAYAATDAFVLPSHFETFGIAALEAAIAGAPLILSRGMIATETFSPHCTWVDPQNVDELTQAIKKSVQLGRSSIDLASRLPLIEEYSWRKITERLIQIYSDLKKQKANP